MRVLIIDNYDSFTYNLAQEIGALGAEVLVYRNDAIDVEGVLALRPDRVVISPGPGTPADAGVSEEVIRRVGPRVPVLGVCLGHQALGTAFGGRVIPASELMHGKTSLVYHDGEGIYRDLPNPFRAARYHSLVLDEMSLPPILKVEARTEDGTIMGVRHRYFPIIGVQFHPESIMTGVGRRLLAAFLS